MRDTRRSSGGGNWANDLYTEVAPPTPKAATPKAATPKARTPAKGLTTEDEAVAAEAWEAEVAASKTPARDFKVTSKHSTLNLRPLNTHTLTQPLNHTPSTFNHTHKIRNPKSMPSTSTPTLRPQVPGSKPKLLNPQA